MTISIMDPSALHLRPAQDIDLSAVSTLAGELVRQHHTWDPQRFMLIEPVEAGYRSWLQTLLADATVVLLVAEHAGEIVGYFYGGLEARDWTSLREAGGFVHDLAVSQKFRRQGIARQLMKAGIEQLKAKGARQVGLSSAVSNAGAQALFRSLGFRSTMVEMTLDF